jgi:hypothetical protein
MDKLSEKTYMEHLNQQNNLVYLRDDAQRFQSNPDNDNFF